MERQSLQRKTEEPGSSSLSDLSSQETIIGSFPIKLEKRIQGWMREATLLSSSLQGISLSQQTNVCLSIENWIREQKKTEVKALLTQLLQSVLLSAGIQSGRSFRLKEKAQHSMQSNKQISKVPQTRSSACWDSVKAYVVEAVDRPLDEKALTEASAKMPEVRLVISSPYIPSEDLKTLGGSIRYPSRQLRFKHMFGVIQNDVNFTVKSNLRFYTHMEKLYGFWCDIIYDPASDDCRLYNRSGLCIYLISSDESLTEQMINSEEQKPLCPGAWRISTKPDETTSCLYPIFDILVRDKSFSISADNDKKVPTVLGRNLFPKDPREIQYTPISLSRTRTSFLDLADGETARIEDLRHPEWTYDLQQVEKISILPRKSIFSCRLSTLPKTNLVAKVFRFDEKCRSQGQMKREMELLKGIRHGNIVSLMSADPRVLALYLEHLPPSLDKISELQPSWADAKTILFDISSALAYLSARKIIHYDVKPSNIAFSRERGAVLFDFDVGDYINPKYQGRGGTFEFLPPETIELKQTRGLPGDVWALGVTILCIMGWYIPTNLRLNMNDFHRPESFTYKMVQQNVQSIDKKRELLDLEHEVQNLVYKMLEPNSEARVTATAIHREDDRNPQGGRSAKKQKHS